MINISEAERKKSYLACLGIIWADLYIAKDIQDYLDNAEEQTRKPFGYKRNLNVFMEDVSFKLFGERYCKIKKNKKTLLLELDNILELEKIHSLDYDEIVKSGKKDVIFQHYKNGVSVPKIFYIENSN